MLRLINRYHADYKLRNGPLGSASVMRFSHATNSIYRFQLTKPFFDGKIDKNSIQMLKNAFIVDGRDFKAH
jgi:hypothetical protein